MQYKYPIFVLEMSRIYFLIKSGGLNHCKDREENRTWCNIISKTNMLKPEIKKSPEDCCGVFDMFKRLVRRSEKSLLILFESCLDFAFSLLHVGYCRCPTAYRLVERFPKV